MTEPPDRAPRPSRTRARRRRAGAPAAAGSPWRSAQSSPLALLLPLVLLALDARSAGWAEIHRVLFRQRSLMLLRNTVVLSVLVVRCARRSSAWPPHGGSSEAGPGRRLWTVLLVLPVAIPDFVVGYAWHSIAPGLNALLARHPGHDPRHLSPGVPPGGGRPSPHRPGTWRTWPTASGVGRFGTFLRVTLPLIRTAVIGGGVLVVLTVISEYGAFEILRYQTFTTEIFTEFQFDAQAAGALSIPLVMLGLLALSIDVIVPRRTAVRLAPRRVAPAAPGMVGAATDGRARRASVVLGVGVPLGTLGYWMAQGQHTTLPAAATLASATWASVRYSAAGAAVAVVCALPVAMMTFRRTSTGRVLLDARPS